MRPPPILAIIVETAARAAYCHRSPVTPTNSPIIALTGHPSGRGSMPLSYLPILGPSMIAQARAVLTDKCIYRNLSVYR
ncbi:hypothetical protein ALC60_07706 [Trachymyrmex zeteki]|uniref:Uncharacterized protein n=1 Tax=Mycetomoellerius zeteki TaxID=64791 RepID=A0A151WYK0_9HYME|nr:hypothetical protein ALC60_07706 [Trachymyrmex zeteki]